MNRHIKPVITFITAHKSDLFAGAGVALFVLAVAATVVIVVLNGRPSHPYPAVDACNLLTESEARTLLGATIINSNNSGPVVSGDTSVSKCSYTDTNPDENRMEVAAVAVRTGVDDKGVAQNAADFKKAETRTGTKAVKTLKHKAFFDETTGQLNILDGHSWVILSYGVGSTQTANTLADGIRLANLVLN